MTAPRVLHVVEALETGVARHVVDVVRHSPGVAHHVVAPPERVGGVTDRTAVPALRAAGAEVTLVPMRRSPARPENLLALRHVRRLVRTWRPDVVHGHSTMGGILARLGAARRPVACAYTPNAVAAGGVATAVERLLGRATDRVVAVSPSEGDDIVRRGLVEAERVTVIPNGIALEPPTPRSLRALLGLPAEVLLVGTMGRVSRQKATDDFVRLCERLAAARADVRFVLIGDGPERRAIESQLAASSLGERFAWLRDLPAAAAHLADLDVFVLPSRFEGGPYAPLEAMRAGVPVVLTDVVGSHDVVEDGRSGVLVAPGDLDALAAAVTGLLDDADRASRLVEAARARLAARFDVEAMGARHAALYAELARARR